jgi:TP901 family phage tail tape measure protein
MAKKFDLSVVLTLIDEFSGKMKKIGASTRAAGQKMSLGLTAPLVGFAAMSIKTATDFQSSMNMVGAVTDTIGKKGFDELSKKAKFLGATTQFSATQAAEAMKFMGMAGMDANQIIGASPKVLQLAAAAQLDMGAASDIVTNIMSSTGKGIGELAHVNDVLVNAFTGSNVNLIQLGEAMKKVGAVSTGLGFNFEETTAALGLLGSAGIQGGEAGTGLRRIMTQMASQTPKQTKIMKELGLSFKDSENNLLPLNKVIEQFEELQKKGASQTLLSEAALKLFGDRGGPQFITLMKAGSEKLKSFTEDLKEEGTAADVAKAQMLGLPGAFKLLASSFEAVQLSIVDSGLGKFVEKLVRSFAKWMQKLSETNPELLAIGVMIAGAVAAIGPLLIALGFVASGIGVVGTAVTLALGPIGLIIIAIAALVAGAILVYKYWDNIAAFFSERIEEILLDFEVMKLKFKKLWTDIIAFIQPAIDTVMNIVNSIWDALPQFIKDRLQGGAGGSPSVPQKTEAYVKVEVSAAKGADAYIKAFSKKGATKVEATSKTETGDTLGESYAAAQ